VEALKSPTLFVKLILGERPIRYQADILEDMSDYIIIVGGRQIGKSTVLAWKSLWNAFVKPNFEVLIIAPTEKQAQVVYQKVYSIVMNNPIMNEYIVKSTMRETIFKNGSVIRCLTSGLTGATARGYSASMIIFDEAALIPDEAYVSLQPALAVKGRQLILSGTPYGKRGYFYEVWSKNELMKRKKWSSYKIITRQNPMISKEFLEEMKNSMTVEQFAQEFEGEFLDDVGRFFSLELVVKNSYDYKYRLKNGEGKTVMGVDVARMGLDESAIVIVRKLPNNKVKVEWAETLSKVELTQLVGRILDILKTIDIDVVAIDTIGMGAGVYDMVRESTSGTVQGVSLLGKERAEAYTQLKVLLEQGNIILNKSDRKMLYQFGNYTAKYSSTGDIKVVKEASGHDDLVDALTLAITQVSSSYHVEVFEEFNELFRYRNDVVSRELDRVRQGNIWRNPYYP